ncbi:alpha/beta fold hydrolase [Dyadobacter psychrotolerans]|uniref:Alpha/beta hydrolase n=1 Tax=Dyadobacter psychrotolerans TaxID=2541721 RepID=A0A4R5DE20_9BACT|nr:alpha/beta hydrolase [Dyadobacter psychrotolerans]TDE12029.1 alpha/beta hydrolase [Dyadobacter psychrotolerans]
MNSSVGHLFILIFTIIITTTFASAQNSVSLPEPDSKTSESGNSLSISSNPTVNVYFLSGLGADKRVFSRLKLDSRISVNHIEWIKPERRETLKHYAGRLVTQIDTAKPFRLVGLSFGGIIASELSEIVHPQQVIIISSTSTGVPVSKFNRGLIRFLLLSPFAAPILKSANKQTYKYFGADTPELKTLLKDILHDTDSRFLKWALARMSGWKREEKAPNLFHIHGTADRLIPINLVQPDIRIEGGGHLMVYGQPEEVSRLLNEHLK